MAATTAYDAHLSPLCHALNHGNDVSAIIDISSNLHKIGITRLSHRTFHDLLHNFADPPTARKIIEPQQITLFYKHHHPDIVEHGDCQH